MSLPSSVVLSTLEFDVLWAALRFPRRHLALDVPSPGATRAERTKVEDAAWAGLTERGLADGSRPDPDLADRLAVLANPQLSVDARIWTEQREIRALSASTGTTAQLAVVDAGQVWLIPARPTSFANSAVSVAGEIAPGPGRSVSLPLAVLREADESVQGDPAALITALNQLGVSLSDAQELSGMFGGIITKGQFGVERTLRNGRVHRAERVIAFHDTHLGRYLFTVRPASDGTGWATVVPSTTARIVANVAELMDEL